MHAVFDAVGNHLGFLAVLGIFIGLLVGHFENEADPLDGERVVNLLPRAAGGPGQETAAGISVADGKNNGTRNADTHRHILEVVILGHVHAHNDAETPVAEMTGATGILAVTHDIPQMNLARIVSRGAVEVAVAGNNLRLVWKLGG